MVKINQTKTIKTALYIRVSTQEQAKHGYSLSSQKERLIEYCKQNGYQIIDTYADEGKSARSKIKSRTQLLRLLEDAKEKKFNRIIFWRLDRWFRNIADYYKVQEILDQNNIDWECTDEEYNTFTSNGRLHLNIKLSIAQNESDQTGDRIRFNFENMIRNGRAITGQNSLPLGYMIVGEEKNKRVVKNPETAPIVEDMFQYILKCGSIRQTLFYINDKYQLNIGYDSMRHYLMNEKYYGSYRGNQSYCDSYITKETYDKIQSIIKHNYKVNKKRDYIFSGLIKCPVCGRNMSGFTSRNYNKTKRYSYSCYRCNHAYAYQSCSNKKRIVENSLEKFLINNIKSEVEKFLIKIENVEQKEEHKQKKVDKNKIKEKLGRLTELYIDGKILREKYDEEFEKLNSLLKQNDEIIENHHKRNLDAYKELIETDFIEIYNKLDNNLKRMFWSKYIDYIEKTEDDEYHIYFK